MGNNYRLKFELAGVGKDDLIKPMSALSYGFRNANGSIHYEWSNDFVRSNPHWFEEVINEFNAGDEVEFEMTIVTNHGGLVVSTKPVKMRGKIKECFYFKNTAKVHFCNHVSGEMQYHEFAFSRLTKISNPKPVLFTTEDGYPITEQYGDHGLWRVFTEPSSFDMWKPYHLGLPADANKPGEKYFFYKNNAEQYILDNKPCLSLNDLVGEPSCIKKEGILFKIIEKVAKEKIDNGSQN